MKRTVTIEIRHDHDGADADKALARVVRDIVDYARDRARRMLCGCAKLTVQEDENGETYSRE